ncbi:MAG: hypothetical protein GF320_18080 [Armatimonadia bacterium]|nr:hypothetical protein [Armatimonadia bacterium]
MTKREFLQLLSAGLGGAVLSSLGSGCASGGGVAGGGGAPAVPPLPNGHQFFPIKSQGQEVGSRAVVDYLPGSAHISDSGHLTFHSRAADESMGLHQVRLSYSGGEPTIQDERTVTHDGDTLPDGRVVKRLGPVDSNHEGHVALVAHGQGADEEDHENLHHGLYVDRGSGPENVLKFGQELPGGHGTFMGTLGDVDIHNNSNVLAVGHYGAGTDDPTPKAGLMHLPGGSTTGMTVPVHTGDLVANSEGVVRGIGLVDMHDDGKYVAQVFADRRGQVSASAMSEGAMTPRFTALLAGHVSAVGAMSVLTASSGLGVGARESADSYYGPRIGGQGVVANVVHLTETTQALVYHGQRVLTTGDTGPAGGEVLGFGPPVVGKDGVVYYLLLSRSAAGMQLVAYNGSEHRILVSRGDQLRPGGPHVETIVFGATTEQVDSNGRLAFTCEFDDGSSSVVVGLPV